MYPAPCDSKPTKCPECGQNTYEWRGVLFASTYVLGKYFCTDVNCRASYERRGNFEYKSKPSATD